MRVINFNAGPAGLPLPPLERAQKEFLEFGKSGMSIMEHSHRGKDYDAVHNEAISLLRELLDVPETHDVLFMQGGAHLQFSLIPLNFLMPGKSADYLTTGHWSKVALSEAKALSAMVGTAREAVTTEHDGVFTRIPKQDELELDSNAAYAHYTTNNTIFGTQWHTIPEVGNVPLIADMSSDFIWKKFDVSKYALAYAGAQKNIGPSGVVVAIARKDFVESGRTDLSKTLKYSTVAKNNSLFNTPPTFSIYMVRNILAWVKEIGGLDAIHARNLKKGELLYGAIDAMSDFYKSPVEKDSRSYMNVVFRLPSQALEEKFVAEAKAANMVGLKGHRAVGGIRASVYNAVSVENIQSLVDFMEKFKKANG
ncbi:MAG: 3-phosphoserine/phosphohydroxythreonine transaminase [Myxococcales bacterium]|jgi:phosphoserine aminotransferase|nr:3-phosphoserine/phosphohydroxythreonine transaminase [Myxococcales bacterium]